MEYANSAEHARFLTHELLPQLEAEFPLVRDRSGRGLLGASFGAVAALSAAYRSPRRYGSLVLMSGSFVSADAGTDHGGGRVFDPVENSSIATANGHVASPTGFSSAVDSMSR